MTEHCHIVPVNLTVLFFLKLKLQVFFQPLSILPAPTRHTEKLPASSAAGSAAGAYNSVFHLHQPFVRLRIGPDGVVAGARKFRRKNLLFVYHLIPIQNHCIFQMLPRHIEGGNVVAGIPVRILNQLHPFVVLRQACKLLLLISRHHINLKNPVFLQCPDHRINHTDTVHADQRFRRVERYRPHSRSSSCRHDNGTFHTMFVPYFAMLHLLHFHLFSLSHSYSSCPSVFASRCITS